VVALKGGVTAQDQDKVGFAIQEVLKLCQALSMDQAPPPASASAMNKWLSDKLEEHNVLNIVEPFWTTSYKRVNTVHNIKPPFFSPNTTYQNWVARWCRFMGNKVSGPKRGGGRGRVRLILSPHAGARERPQSLEEALRGLRQHHARAVGSQRGGVPAAAARPRRGVLRGRRR
jgi:hypothetical protein